MLNWPAKDPDEILDYQVDWTARLETGETITTSVFLQPAGDAVMVSDDLVDALATLWLSGGTVGVDNIFTNRITTNQGRTYDQSVRAKIKVR